VKAVGAITEWNPALTKAVALAGVAYGAYKVLWAGLFAGPGPLQRLVVGVGALAGRMSAGLGVAAEWAVGIGVGGVAAAAGLTLGVAALAAGLGYAAYWMTHTTSATQDHIAALRTAYHATGNNVAGYEAMDRALQRNIAALGNAGAAMHAAAQGEVRFGEVSNGAIGASYALHQALQANQQTLSNISANANHFGDVLGMTAAQVRNFATATGVDLTGHLKVGSAQFVADASKIQGYATAVALSHNPMAQFKVDAQQSRNAANTLAQQIQFLAAAYNALVTPTLNVIQGAVTLKTDQRNLTAALQASGGAVGLQNQQTQAAAAALVQYANDTIAQSNAVKAQTGSTSAAIAPLKSFASWLSTTGAHGAYVNQILRLIKQAEDALYDKKITITTDFRQIGAVPPGGGNVSVTSGSAGHATGPGGTSMTPGMIFLGSGNHSVPHHMLVTAPTTGGGGGAEPGRELKVVVMLDGQELHQAQARAVYADNARNNNRAPDGRPRGTLAPRPI
jgi:hypothetical protein